MKSIRSMVQHHPVGSFVLLAYLLTIVSIPVAYTAPDLFPLMLSLWPVLLAIALASLADGRGGIRALFARMTRWRVKPIWYIAAFGIPLLGTLLMVVIAIVLGSTTALNFGYFSVALILLSYIFNAFEELGWRAFVLPKLLKDHPPFTAGLIIGVFWSGIHLALHLPGNWYDGYPILPTILILFGYSILATWIFVNTGGSAWMTTLFHGSLNVLTPLTAGMDQIQAWWLRALVFCGLAIVVILLSGRVFRQRQETTSAHTYLEHSQDTL